MKRFLAAATAAVLAAAPASRAAEPTTLKLAFPPPPVSFFYGKVLVPWSKAIEKDSHGAVKVQIFTGPTLANFGNIYDRLLNGVIDLGWGLHGPFGRLFRKTEVTTVPGNLAPGPECAEALWQLYETGVIADEYTKVKPLALGCFSGGSIISTKLIRSVDDIKGLKVEVGSKVQGEIVERLGGAPITGNTADIYQGLQRGTYEAAMTGWAAVAAFKLFEVSKYGFDAPLGNPTNFLLMNKASFAKLPAVARKAIEAHSGLALSKMMGVAGERENAHGRSVAEHMPGHKIVTMPKSGVAKLRETLRPVIDDWVKSTPDGAHVLAAYEAALAKMGGGN